MTIDAFGDEQLSREIIRFRNRGMDMRTAFAEVHRRFLALEKEQFDSQGKYSRGWKPLKSSTIDGKHRHGMDPRILHATLRLRRSLTSNNSDHVFVSKPGEMHIASKVKYGAFHQSGTKHMPKRPPVDIPARERNDWMKILQRYLVGG